MLNAKQRLAFDRIMTSLSEQSRLPLPIVFFNGPARSGKMFLYQVLDEELRRIGKSTFCTAFSGNAAQPLPDGTTCHTGYETPLHRREDEPRSSIGMESARATRLREASLHCIDEVSMMRSWHLDVIDNVLNVSIMLKLLHLLYRKRHWWLI